MTAGASVARRVAVVAGGALLAAATLAGGLAGVARGGAPETALRYWPWDSRARQNAIDRRLGAHPDAPLAPLVVSARRAFARDATAIKAIRLLALDAAAKGQLVRSDRLVDYAAALSRRDLPTQLLLIERRVSRNDPDGALREFDVALRTTYAAADTLHPVLDGAMADRGLTEPFVRLLRRDPPWMTSFYASVVPTTEWPARYAALLMRVPQSAPARNRDVQRLVLDAMVRRGEYAAALAYQRFLWRARGAGSDAAPDAGFTQQQVAGPFDWNYADESGYGAERLVDQGEVGGIAYRAAAGDGGAVVTRLLALTPGRYRFAFRSQDAAAGRQRPQWTLTCLPRGPVVLEATVPRSGEKLATTQQAFAVPAGCAAQRLALTVEGGDEPEGVEGRILSAAVRR